MVTAVMDPVVSGLTEELRSEIEKILQTAGEGTRHAMAYRAIQEGRDAEQVAKEWERSKSYAVMVLRSVRYLLDGELPRASSMIITNSYVYRELLDCHPSEELRAYAMACLRELHARNREVRVKPMGQNVCTDPSGVRKPKRSLTFCSTCFLALPCECE